MTAMTTAEAAQRFLRNCQYLDDHLGALDRLFSSQMDLFITMSKDIRAENDELKLRIAGLEK